MNKNSQQGEWEEFDKKFVSENNARQKCWGVMGMNHNNVKSFISTHFISKSEVERCVESIKVLPWKLRFSKTEEAKASLAGRSEHYVMGLTDASNHLKEQLLK